MEPLISIVIANYNYGRFLEDAIQSVISQDMGDNVELIVCDAASTDNSVNIIKKYANGLPPNTSYYDWAKSNPSLTTNNQRLTTKVTWWCSEKDGGQSAAFNKGFSHANGRFLTWLNADDILLPGVVKNLCLASRRYPHCEWFVGGCMWLTPGMQIFKCGRARKMSMRRVRHGEINVCGPSSFFKKELLERVGGVDERFHYTMDIDLWLRFAFKGNARFRPFIDYAWGLRLHPQSKMSGHKFLPSGEILEGSLSKEAFVKDEKKVRQVQNEKRWVEERFNLPQYGMSALVKFLTADYVPALMSRLDSWRYKGRDLGDVIPGIPSADSMEGRHDGVLYKKELLDLLRRVDLVLGNCGIEYFAVYGTCLGAVREHSIIPWDDDVDIAVWRKDFQRAIQALNMSEQQIFAGDRNSIPGCPIRCGRIFNRVDSDSTIERKRAYVDLYVIDFAPKSRLRFYWDVLWYVGVTRIIAKRKNACQSGHVVLYAVADFLALPLRILPISVLYKFSDWLYIYKKRSQFVKVTFDGNRNRYCARTFDASMRVDFSGLKVSVPVGYDDFLTTCYGDWRTPPKVEDRLSHAFDRSGIVWTVPCPSDEIRQLLHSNN